MSAPITLLLTQNKVAIICHKICSSNLVKADVVLQDTFWRVKAVVKCQELERLLRHANLGESEPADDVKNLYR